MFPEANKPAAMNANEIAGSRESILIHALNDTVHAQKQLIAKLNEEIQRLKGANSNQITFIPNPTGGSSVTVPNFTPWVSPPISPEPSPYPFRPPGIQITCDNGAKPQTVSFHHVGISEVTQYLKDTLKE